MHPGPGGLAYPTALTIYLQRLRSTMTPSTNLVRMCRDSGLSGADIQSLVTALQPRGRASASRSHGWGAQRTTRMVTAAVAVARTWLSTLR